MVERRYAHVGFCRQLLDAQVFGVFMSRILLPDDLPDLVQMIGRAGRDGEPARAFLLWSSLALDVAPDELAYFYRPENCNWQYIAKYL